MTCKKLSNDENRQSFYSDLIFRLKWSLPLVTLVIPFWVAWKLWHLWFLRPVLLYAFIMPYLWSPFSIMLISIAAICHQLNVRKGTFFKLTYFFAKYIGKPYMDLLHGYEIEGLENLPPAGQGSLVVFYHGLVPIDIIFFAVTYFLKTGTLVGGVAHKQLFNIPLIGTFLKSYEFSSASRSDLVSDLKDGKIRFVAPGGEYEGIFSDDYELMWRNRVGFAQTAKDAGVPVVPMFTINNRQFIRMHFFGMKESMLRLHERNRFPILYLFGGFPVKLKTFLGEPISCGADESAEDFAIRIKKAVEDLRDKHQRKNNTILQALLDRVR